MCRSDGPRGKDRKGRRSLYRLHRRFRLPGPDSDRFDRSVRCSPPIEHLHRFLGTSYFTCVDCDGYRTTGKKLVVTGSSLNAVNLALAMKQMFTKDTTFIPYELSLPPSSSEVLADEGIPVVPESPSGSSARRSWKGSSLRTVRV